MIPCAFPTLFLQGEKRVQRIQTMQPVSDCESTGKVAHPARLERAACGFEIHSGPFLITRVNA